MNLDIQKYAAITLSYAIPGALIIGALAIGRPDEIQALGKSLDESIPAPYSSAVLFIFVIWIGLVVDAFRLIIFQKLPALVNAIRKKHQDATDNWDMKQLIDEQKRTLYEIQRNRWYSSYLVYANSSIAIALAIVMDITMGLAITNLVQKALLVTLCVILAVVGLSALGTFNKYAAQIATRSQQ